MSELVQIVESVFKADPLGCALRWSLDIQGCSLIYTHPGERPCRIWCPSQEEEPRLHHYDALNFPAHSERVFFFFQEHLTFSLAEVK